MFNAGYNISGELSRNNHETLLSEEATTSEEQALMDSDQQSP